MKEEMKSGRVSRKSREKVRLRGRGEAVQGIEIEFSVGVWVYSYCSLERGGKGVSKRMSCKNQLP